MMRESYLRGQTFYDPLHMIVNHDDRLVGTAKVNKHLYNGGLFWLKKTNKLTLVI